MTRRGEKGLDLSGITAQTNSAERELHGLLEELIDSMNRAKPESTLTLDAHEIAHAAARLAEELETADASEMGGKTKMIEELGERTDRLLRQLPDAVLAGEHPKWSAEMEDIQAHIHAIRGSVEQLTLPHLHPQMRKKHEESVHARLFGAKRKLMAVKAAVREKRHVAAHPLHVQLTRVKSAIGAAQAHVNTRMKMHLREQKEMEARKKAEEAAEMAEREQAAREQSISSAVEEMRQTFARQMSGRFYVDWSTVQMRSEVTGQVKEWPMDEVMAAALGRLMANWEAIKTIEHVKGQAATWAARFEVVSGEDGIRLMLDGGERTISTEAVVYSPQKFVVAL